MADENIPDADLSQVKAQLESQQANDQDNPEDLDLGQFKNPKDMLKSYNKLPSKPPNRPQQHSKSVS
jgi:hypothetical protein